MGLKQFYFFIFTKKTQFIDSQIHLALDDCCSRFV